VQHGADCPGGGSPPCVARVLVVLAGLSHLRASCFSGWVVDPYVWLVQHRSRGRGSTRFAEGCGPYCVTVAKAICSSGVVPDSLAVSAYRLHFSPSYAPIVWSSGLTVPGRS